MNLRERLNAKGAQDVRYASNSKRVARIIDVDCVHPAG